MTDEQTTMIDDEMPSGVSSDFLTTEDKELLVESGQTIWIVDCSDDPDARFGHAATYNIQDENGEISRLTMTITDKKTKITNKARLNQYNWFRKRLINSGDKIPVRLVKKGRAYDFDKPLDDIPF